MHGLLRRVHGRKAYTNITQQESEKERDTVALLRGVSVQAVSLLNIDAFPSAIVSAATGALRIAARAKKKNSRPKIALPPTPPHSSPPVIDNPGSRNEHFGCSRKEASGQHLLPVSPSELWSLWKRVVAMLSRPCHFHSRAAALLFHLSSALRAART